MVAYFVVVLQLTNVYLLVWFSSAILYSSILTSVKFQVQVIVAALADLEADQFEEMLFAPFSDSENDDKFVQVHKIPSTV